MSKESLKIVILDSFPFDNGDLNLSEFEKFGNLRVYQRTNAEQTPERLQDADVVFTNKVPIGKSDLEAASQLKMISVLATGTNVIDITAATKKGVIVCNVPAYSSPSTAQATIALLLELTQRVGLHDRLVREGEWRRANAFSSWQGRLIELEGKTMAVFGLGEIGSRVARVAEALGMRVIGLERKGAKDQSWERKPFESAMKEADVISLNCTLTPETEGLIDEKSLGLVKKTCLIVNTSRGELVDESAMACALHEGRLAGYATDVLSSEPPDRDHPLLKAPNCIITSHLGWATLESRQRLLEASLENLKAFIRGEPVHQVT